MIVVSLHTDDIIALPGIICYGMFLHREVFLMGWVLSEFEAFSNIYSENYVEFHFVFTHLNLFHGHLDLII